MSDRYLIAAKIRGQTWVWSFDDLRAVDVARSALRFAHDPDLDFTFTEAVQIAKAAQERVKKSIPVVATGKGALSLSDALLSRGGAQEPPRRGQGGMKQ